MSSESYHQMINNQITVETAEGIDISMVPAGIAVRTYAFTLDLFFRALIAVGTLLVFNAFGDFGVGLFFIALFVVEWFYPVLFEIFKGATPGKMLFKLRVVYDSGLPISFAGSLTRNLFRFIDFLPFCYLAGAISMLLNSQCKRLGDVVAGTTVVYTEPKYEIAEFDFQNTQIDMPSMTTEQQGQIISFAERESLLSEARKIELAEHLSPIINANGQEAVDKIKTIAAVLVGRL
ncbi:RDD family protein [Agaribacter flavus]|uniref:RDD family protein n=1 Tax=Agaribacter flavus TaxID=1902781 RepID=A0ABV7FLD5_9ALTE